MKAVFYLLLSILIVMPLLMLTAAAFAGVWVFPEILPQNWSLRAWRFITGNGPAIAAALASSALYSLATVVTAALLCWLPAQFLARNRFAGQGMLEAVLLTPALVPAITFSMGLQVVFIRLGLADSIPGVVLVLSLTSYPYMLRALKTGYLAYSRQFDECARNLGAGEVQRVLQVELPMVLPAALSGSGVVFLAAFSEYFLVFLIGGGLVRSFPGYLVPYISGSERSIAAALTLVFLAIPLLLFLLQELFLQWYYHRKGIETR